MQEPGLCWVAKGLAQHAGSSGLHTKHRGGESQWNIPQVPALGRQNGAEFKAIPSYIGSSRSDWDI